eukprot:CAMPEP_0201622564 /NCGR_PEP_ID=MMETSP0492-20130828/47466_1 /ASSEMBLY_ACC=CAM_ASM_000837 /TAXON_ID=420259 /ORGANISM="Thalassiosira gravida, Strain GMp14c1" /LENGTH=151 /DNA_ID=CAMNT_0048092149 /DNA_START=489 /DNA_END=944 /DNA_ORIENTATION=-
MTDLVFPLDLVTHSYPHELTYPLLSLIPSLESQQKNTCAHNNTHKAAKFLIPQEFWVHSSRGNVLGALLLLDTFYHPSGQQVHQFNSEERVKMVKQKNTCAHNNTHKAHANGIKKKKRTKYVSTRGMDPKFLRNQKFCKKYNNSKRPQDDE